MLVTHEENVRRIRADTDIPDWAGWDEIGITIDKTSGLWRVSKRTRFRQGWRVRLRIGHGQVPHRQAKACPTAASHSDDSLSTSIGRLTRIADMSQFNPSTDRSPLPPRGSEGPIAVTKSTRIGPPAVNLTPMPHRHT